MLTVSNVGLRYGDKKLFEEVNLNSLQETATVSSEQMELEIYFFKNFSR